MSNTMRCTACGKIADANVGERAADSGGLQVYLACGNCGAEYPAAEISAKGVRLQAQLEELRAVGRGDTREFRRLLKRYQREVRELVPE